jgi:hypothetical protein
VTIGWYIHHHGSGHLRRFQAVRAHLGAVVALSSLPRPAEVPASEWISLPLDVPVAGEGDPTAGGRLHWAPLRHPGLRTRMARIGEWLAQTPASLLVCDVSVEIATYARLMGVPVAWIAQRGARLDRPHQLAYGISSVLAPWTRALASPGSGLPAETSYLGALSRFDGRAPVSPPGRGRVLVLLGEGGHGVRAEQLTAAANATPGWSWTVAGLGEASAGGPVRDLGRVPDVWPLLCAADVVVASAGSNLVAEVAAARRPLVCLPQERPFGEQHEQAAALERCGLAQALGTWPSPGGWPAVLTQALARDPGAWSQAHDGHGGRRLAAAIDTLACASA